MLSVCCYLDHFKDSSSGQYIWSETPPLPGAYICEQLKNKGEMEKTELKHIKMKKWFTTISPGIYTYFDLVLITISPVGDMSQLENKAE